MRKFTATALFTLVCIICIISCTKYKDPAPTTDPRLTNHYCNDPLAVNYNWNFPGKPDNTVCFYPTDVFAGRYYFSDSVFLKNGYYFVRADSIIITLRRLTSTRMSLTGWCPNGDSLILTATPTFLASLDTLVGDSITARGQTFCGMPDTIVGYITENRIDSVLSINFEVAADTGVVTLHVGTARLIR